MKKLTKECGHTFVDIESYQSLEKEVEDIKQKLNKAIELIERAYPVIVKYKYQSAINKHEADVEWSIDWQEKANEFI